MIWGIIFGIIIGYRELIGIKNIKLFNTNYFIYY